jgi:lipopolysaccharide cholinephosphotransferase
MVKGFDWLFKKEACDATHYRVTLFNCIKFSYLNERAKELSKENDFVQYKKNNVDITTVPKAKGQLRKIQLANLRLLLELDKVCKANGLKYWLDGGTQIGAVRHKGYIPWDDDIDCGMLREDYDKIIKAFEKSSSDPDIYADYFRGRVECFIKVKHRKNPHIFVDIFPFDMYDRKLTDIERRDISKIAVETREYIKKNQDKTASNEDHLKWIHKLRDERILINGQGKHTDEPAIFWGLDYAHRWKLWFHKYDTFFPLKEVEFEGYSLPIINRPDVFLTDVYGDYMNYPSVKTMGHKHSMLATMSEDELSALESLASEF